MTEMVHLVIIPFSCRWQSDVSVLEVTVNMKILATLLSEGFPTFYLLRMSWRSASACFFFLLTTPYMFFEGMELLPQLDLDGSGVSGSGVSGLGIYFLDNTVSFCCIAANYASHCMESVVSRHLKASTYEWIQAQTQYRAVLRFLQVLL